MRRVWRSWFWNIFLALAMGIMAGIAVGVVFTEKNTVVAALFGVGAVVLWFLTVRSLMLGVKVSADGVVVRELGRTRSIPWSTVVEIAIDNQHAGLAGSLGATAPIIRTAPTADGQECGMVELNVLGSYGLSPFRPTIDQRAVVDLNNHLNAWRSAQGTHAG